MGKRGPVLSCFVSLGMFALGATISHFGTRRRNARAHRHSASASSPTCRVCANRSAASPAADSDSAPSSSPPQLATSTAAAVAATAPPPAPAPMPAPSAAAPSTEGAAPKPGSSEPRLPPLDCPVCLTEFVLPRVTACGHTVCTTCLCALWEHERRPGCPVCRRRIRPTVDKIPVNFIVHALVEERVATRGEPALAAHRALVEQARMLVEPASSAMGGSGGGGSGGDGGAAFGDGGAGFVNRLRPAWNWFKWTVIIVTEFGAFLVSLKEVLESAPARSRRYQRIA